MLMPGRSHTQPNSNFRYGFNGKENDNEIKGEGNQQDYGMRIYDSRLSCFLSIDPFQKFVVKESPYIFSGNNPVAFNDFQGAFRISPYFVKKYPTLAKLLKEVFPRYISNIPVRDEWIFKMGFSDKNKGISAWEEMLTYGSGPWVTPTLSEEEVNSCSYLPPSRFIGTSNWSQYSESDGFPDNFGIKSEHLDKLEAALKQNNDKDVAFYVMHVFILVIHEGSHWARAMKVQKSESDDWCYEMGAKGEEAFFGGVRFHYSKCFSANLQSQVADDKKVRKYSNGLLAVLNFFTKRSFSSTINKIKTPEGHKGDPFTTKTKIYTQNGTYDTEPKQSKSTEYTY